MEEVLKWKDHLFNLWNAFRSEIILIFISIIITIVSFSSYFFLQKSTQSSQSTTVGISPSVQKDTLVMAEISGAVFHPGVYSFREGDRIVDLLDKGELTSNADFRFIAQSVNQAEVLHDEEKLYIPSLGEIPGGVYPLSSPQKSQENIKISLNKATEVELDTLPGVGQITAQKIINNRPYQNTHDLVVKKIISESAYTKVQNQIQVP